MKILKFGGSSLADGPRIAAATAIIADAAAADSIAVVFSAMQGVTDRLIAAARQAVKGAEGGRSALEEIRARHLAAVRHLFAAPGQSAVIAPLSFLLNELEEILHGIELIRECSPRTLDLVMSFGERLSCTLAAAHLRSRGLDPLLLDARELIRTDAAFGAAGVDFPETYTRIRSRLQGLRGVAVLPGFIAATADGVTTTLGRNGSDYTASLVAAGAGAAVIEIWTDVDGVLSADPRLVPDAYVIPEISYEEAMELSYFGARVLHPYTMLPAVEKGIPIRIRNSLNPAAPGTLIGAPHHLEGRSNGRDGENGHPITGIASIEDISLVNIEGGGMIGIPGIAARVFSALARERINIIMISQASSEHTITLVLRSGEAARALAALETELAMELSSRRIQALERIDELLIISVIGEKMRGKPGLAGRLFTALGEAGVNILAIAQGSAERNISIVIEEKNHALALRAIHAAFLAAPVTAAGRPAAEPPAGRREA
ncbi:MAG TPA: aspartate kinase [bacterium]|nr:aspartate kinase [bacterium]HQI47929.1 aspartate kinase [bacterium]HQJ64414.1 aspartate kinase [bacterium]HQJ65526.1 aspartate kinase [bacterium]